MEYVSPIDERVKEAEPLAPRMAGIEGKSVALLDISKNRGAEFLDRLELHLHELCLNPSAAKEIRIAGSGPELSHRATALWDQATRTRQRAHQRYHHQVGPAP